MRSAEDSLGPLHQALARFTTIAPPVDHWSLRLTTEQSDAVALRQGVLEPVQHRRSAGAMVTIHHAGGAGYAATADLSTGGLRAAADAALEWARASAGHMAAKPDASRRSIQQGTYASRVGQSWTSIPLGEKIAALHAADEALARDDRICYREASLEGRRRAAVLADADGARVEQIHEHVKPYLEASASDGHVTQKRSWGGVSGLVQGGLEHIPFELLDEEARRVGAEAIELLGAPPCPTGRMDLILLPTQMVLQIHESIGHPLELDRILGDERNYAGGSFVTPGMFGTYRYGSGLLNVTFDPTRGEQVASYGFDDDGVPAEREYVIRDGRLLRPLGGALSQARAGLPGVAASRTCDWTRPPIDRMANLNVEPGSSSLADLIAGVERGILMDTNRSWSIDDQRNKFQFGCEFGRLIRDGEPGTVVRSPGYRGVSATFWRSLDGVGDASTCQVLGVTNCGKGEPNQMVHVGHASPACRFRRVDVFGGS